MVMTKCVFAHQIHPGQADLLSGSVVIRKSSPPLGEVSEDPWSDVASIRSLVLGFPGVYVWAGASDLNSLCLNYLIGKRSRTLLIFLDFARIK